MWGKYAYRLTMFSSYGPSTSIHYPTLNEAKDARNRLLDAGAVVHIKRVPNPYAWFTWPEEAM